MSAIGSYVRLRTADLNRCLELVAKATPDWPFGWPWQRQAESSRDAFAREWASAVLEEVVFDGIEDPFDSAEAATLGRVFTAASPARVAVPVPEFDEEALRRFCEAEWGSDAPGMYDGIAAAHASSNAGMVRLTDDEAVVFIVS